MRYDEMMSALSCISERYETTLTILSDAIGYEFTEALLAPLFEHILPSKDSMATESFLKAIDEIAAKIYFYRDAVTHDLYYSRIEDFAHNYKAPPKEEED